MPVLTRVAVDPMSMMFGDLLEQHPELWEKVHPHVPRETIAEAVRAMTPARRQAYLAMARAMIDYARPWVEALEATGNSPTGGVDRNAVAPGWPLL